MYLDERTYQVAHSIELAMDQERSEDQWRIMDQKIIEDQWRATYHSRSSDVPGRRHLTYGVSRPRADSSSYHNKMSSASSANTRLGNQFHHRKNIQLLTPSGVRDGNLQALACGVL
jgi:hypothetical protein